MRHAVVGDGPHHVIALHGWFGSAMGWGSFRKFINEELFTVHFMNYRGYGSRREEPGEFTLDEISGDVRRLADDEGLSRYSLLGHSMGGAAALRVLADDPERVTAVVGASPVCAMPLQPDAELRTLSRRAAEDPEARAAIIHRLSGGRNTSVWVDQVVQHSIQNSAAKAFDAYLSSWSRADFSHELGNSRVPVMVTPGRFDPVLGELAMRQTWLQLFPQAKMVTIENAGHFPMDEAPVNFATVVEGFLASV